MSLIDDALRRAQQATTAPRTPSQWADGLPPVSAPRSEGVVHSATVALQSSAAAAAPRAADLRAADVRPVRRWPSLATIVLIVLAAWTFWAISQPGWGLGSNAWWLRTDGLPELAEIPTSLPPARTQPAPKLAGETFVPPRSSDPRYTPSQPALRGDLLRVQPPASAAPTSSTSLESARPAESQAPAPAIQDIAQQFQLSGILLTGRTRRAVINGAILSVGDRIDGAVITAIDRGSVTLTMGDEVHQLALRSPR